MNMTRRQLSTGAKAIYGAKLKAYQAVLAAERQRDALKRGDQVPVPENLPERQISGDARDIAAKAVGLARIFHQ